MSNVKNTHTQTTNVTCELRCSRIYKNTAHKNTKCTHKIFTPQCFCQTNVIMFCSSVSIYILSIGASICCLYAVFCENEKIDECNYQHYRYTALLFWLSCNLCYTMNQKKNIFSEYFYFFHWLVTVVYFYLGQASIQNSFYFKIFSGKCAYRNTTTRLDSNGLHSEKMLWTSSSCRCPLDGVIVLYHQYSHWQSAVMSFACRVCLSQTERTINEIVNVKLNIE